ncbi:DUF3696 domain-containing protein [Pseudomonas fulva]|uniref:DUF3696 domain-containing protein n=1 Tax=Pseudomonas fulva TaxID=47880 RepID=UPI00346338E2
MITSLALKNFKSIQNTTTLQLQNLSLICGSNSSGKSSVIQALLMLSQTFSSRYIRRSVSLNGRLVRLGSFNDIFNHASSEIEKEKDRAIDIEFNMEMPHGGPFAGIKKISIALTFTIQSESNKKFDSEFHPEITSGKIYLEKIDNEANVEQIEFTSQEPGKANGDLFIVTHLESASKSLISKQYPDYKIEGVSKHDLVPHNLHVVYDLTKRLSQNIVPFLIGTPNYLKTVNDEDIEKLTNLDIPKPVLYKLRALIEAENEELVRNFVLPDEILEILKNEHHRFDENHVRSILARQSVTLNHEKLAKLFESESITIDHWRAAVGEFNDKEKKALSDVLIRNRDEIQGTWYINMKRIRAKATYSLSALSDLEIFLSYFFPRSLKYLGPLRYEPQAMYQAFDLSEPKTVGLKGENTAAVLHLNSSLKLSYLLATEKDNGSIEFVTKENSLSTACTEWLTYMGVITEFQTFDKGKLGYELQVKTRESDKMQDLTHVGVGVSQVLPIVVMALLSEPDDILIFEQPELHLHPKVQSRLTDFFLALSKDRQLIIETHSEYLINRLRLRIVQSRDNKIKNSSTILFVNKNDEGSQFQKVDITSYGSIIDWPNEFFDQTDSEVENILLEAVNKKKEAAASKETRPQ